MRIQTSHLTENLRLLSASFSAYKLRIVLLATLGFLSGILEGVGINAVVPMFSLVTHETFIQDDPLTRMTQSLFSHLHLNFTPPLLIAFIILLFICKALILLIANAVNAVITADYETSVRQKLYAATLAARWPYLAQQKIGHLEKILMDHVGNGASALMYLASAILLLTSLIMYVLVALNISVVITLITLALGGLFFLLFKPLLYKTRVMSQRFLNTAKEVAHHINEHMIGIKTVKTFNAEAPTAAHADIFFRRLRRSRIWMSIYTSIPNTLIQPLTIIFILVLFACAYPQPGFQIASFAVILYLIQKIFSYVQSVQTKLQSLNEIAPYLRSVADYMHNIAAQAESVDSHGLSFSFHTLLEMKDVSFSYSPERPVINRLSLMLPRGGVFGLIGSSGAGKTTLVDLLMRLLEPSQGQILLDGIPYASFAVNDWRRHIGYVSQDVFLLNDTVAHNISFYNETITRAKREEAARAAFIHDFIVNLPQGYDTVVGERGASLSAGQRQRIILARALAREPQLLILDEATSSLDNESEAAIQRSLQALKGKVTILIIAHRISTVLNTDMIFALDQGRIIEQGAPQELMNNANSYLSKMHNLAEHFSP
ncbi:hypothetical protein A3I42_00470 [Candidatus Uhrbacteria bacterium RIFCSPLOWO2_02_FULL_49_11]|uniref:ABC transporter ATP-binding protein n=1 Tax=Candidatus Uhrbacteria bacterium RIFCSPLOWO2_02_FULL_49_11 TaxID=1802409 RepID=A0A1F7VDV3_9BACT|nr:MAG: hypothetical protein A3I42_00470 [Candidatus Uhrbacteria bacterium RIFCSPLOWO2_02_FULL_49_11]